ncbi:MAG: prevent-host-death protein [Gammaproteobacteria bacterium]|nr:MAG: prevent-host-death protein [Gammaproteobacteria bacterium]
MLSITANDLKRSGVSGIERAMQSCNDTGVMVDVRGKAKYVILAVSEFNQFREYQLDQAIAEAENCLAQNKYLIINDLDNYAEQLTKEVLDDL